MESTITSKIATSSTKDNLIGQISIVKYWFETSDLSSNELLFLVAVASVMTLLTFGIVIFRYLLKGLVPPQKKFFSKIILYIVWFAPSAWLLLLLQYLGVGFFSARVVWLVWVAALIIVFYILYKGYKNTLPALKQSYLSYQLKKSYFPKTKKKKRS